MAAGRASEAIGIASKADGRPHRQRVGLSLRTSTSAVSTTSGSKTTTSSTIADATTAAITNPTLSPLA